MAKKTTKTARPKRPITSNGEHKLEFRDPPEPARKSLTLPAETLKKAEGKWAVIGTKNSKEGAASSASALRTRLKKEGIEGFEIRNAGEEIFARYVG